jgi:spore germination protein
VERLETYMPSMHGRRALERRSWRMRGAAAVTSLLLGASALSAEELQPVAAGTGRPAFREIWAYVLRGEEAELTGSEPISDICYFGVNLSREGRIAETVRRPEFTLSGGLKPAVHLVVAELSNYALVHFSLNPEYGVRPRLIEDICRVADPFDGVQVDFESVARDDAEYFFDFLKGLKEALPADKKLSIAVPARMKPIEADAYDYSRIAPIVDRVIVMAYDEHWSTSSPGPIASLPWCAKVVDFAASVIETGKIVMGLPLYGRAWQDKRLAKALRFENVEELVAQTNSATSYEPELGPYFEYSENVVVKVFYDDERSIMEKLRLYRTRDIGSVSFWRIGLGPPQLWSGIALAGGEQRAGTAPATTVAPATQQQPPAGTDEAVAE